jgi:hypothetical protein
MLRACQGIIFARTSPDPHASPGLRVTQPGPHASPSPIHCHRRRRLRLQEPIVIVVVIVIEAAGDQLHPNPLRQSWRGARRYGQMQTSRNNKCASQQIVSKNRRTSISEGVSDVYGSSPVASAASSLSAGLSGVIPISTLSRRA